jgi:hypothetical protein
MAWWAKLLGDEPKSHHFTVSWPALGYLALVLIPYGTSRWLWRIWNEAEMRAIVERRPPHAVLSVPTSMLFQLVFATGLVYKSVPPGWVLFFLVVGVAGGFFMAVYSLDLRLSTDHEVATVVSSEARSNVDAVWAFVKTYGLFLCFLFIMGSGSWAALVGLVDTFFSGSVLGFKPSEVSGELVGALFAAIGFIALLIWFLLPAEMRAQLARNPRIKQLFK